MTGVAIALSTFKHERDNRPRPLSRDFDGLVEMLRSARRSPCTLETCGIGEHAKIKDGKAIGCRHKYDVGAWSPAYYGAGSVRKQAEVAGVSLLSVDIDHAGDEVFAEVACKVGRYRHIAHATHSDRPSDRCIRIVLPLSRSVTRTEWPRFWRAAMRMLDLAADTQCCDANRLYFLPSRPADADYFFVASECDRVIDVEEVLALAEPEPVRTVRPRDATITDEAAAVRYRKYLATMPPSISKQHGHRALFDAVAVGLVGFEISESVVRDVIWSDFNPRCQPPWSERDIEHKLTSVAATCEREPGYLRNAPREDRALRLVGDSQPTASATADVDANAEFACSKESGKIYMTQANIMLAVRKLGVSIEHDEFARQDLMHGLDGHGPQISDAALNELRLRIDERFQFRPSKEFFSDVISRHAGLARRHPVREYLDAQAWDGTARIDSFLIDLAGAEDTPYVRAVSRLFLLAAVRRIRQPGCKFDEMPILESPQGTNKSTGLSVMAVREEWFSDELPLDGDTQTLMTRTAGKWIVEAGELKGLHRSESANLKAMLSRRIDEARMPYGRRSTVAPRQFVIVGTTNEQGGYLKDSTGNRRFWPVRIRGFDLARLRDDRDQLWAEAAHYEAKGESIRLDPSLWAAAAVEQTHRETEDPIRILLEEALGDSTGKIRVVDCYAIVGVQPGDASNDQQTRVGAAMRQLGWERKQRRFGEGPEWAYLKGDAEQREQLIVVESGRVTRNGRNGRTSRHWGVA